MKTYTFDNDFGPEELAKALLDAGFSRSDTLERIISGKVDDVDKNVTLGVTVDEDEVLDKLDAETIAAAYRDMSCGGGNDREVEDGIRYVRSGELGLAVAMFARVFEGAELAAAERALT
ncbi:hypothetical protein ASE95_02875 [Sphingomonas sp. Leaf231]|uniref:hypothetical protein n=1 Tax=Sphingomonas sp. Leaf231 TaxID=1736301 RepID=UPI0006FE82B3|nr:hypothetical protein [Sphingomonas sp. Leaf231]KQN93864.1 hypothetical protein ASE95_02875 [Sphingomonas sp. Leaf231]